MIRQLHTGQDNHTRVVLRGELIFRLELLRSVILTNGGGPPRSFLRLRQVLV